MRCIERARKERQAAGDAFRENYTHQDAALLNVVRACEAAVDLANMLIRKRRLGIPSETRESFGLLERARMLSPELGDRLRKMVGFHNIAVHRYDKLNLDIVESVIQNNLDDLLVFAETLRPLLEET